MLQASCKTVVLDTDPAFTRLEHHKIHEYARAAANRQNRPFNMYKVIPWLKSHTKAVYFSRRN